MKGRRTQANIWPRIQVELEEEEKEEDEEENNTTTRQPESLKRKKASKFGARLFQ